MKATVVPAQVTTVEDRIAGSLGFSQLILCIIPLFVSAGLYALVPPFMGGTFLKYSLMVLLSTICCILAIRIKGKIVLNWLITITHYNLRPRLYLYNKNSPSCREEYARKESAKLQDKKQSVEKTNKVKFSPMPLGDSAFALAAIEDMGSNVRFETTKKGGLHVRFNKIQE